MPWLCKNCLLLAQDANHMEGGKTPIFPFSRMMSAPFFDAINTMSVANGWSFGATHQGSWMVLWGKSSRLHVHGRVDGTQWNTPAWVCYRKVFPSMQCAVLCGLGCLRPEVIPQDMADGRVAWCGRHVREHQIGQVRVHWPFIHLPSVHLWIYPSVKLSIYPSIDLSIFPSFHLSTYPTIHRSIDQSIKLSICLSIYLSVCLSIYLSVCLSVYLIYLSTYLSIYLSMYLPTYLAN